jgi:5-methyltetrahydropteroyltriglutamate--homocysteine methyltransferase
MPISHTLGFPPLGAARELKRTTEGYWSGKVSRESLLSTGAELRARHWRLQRDAGIDLPASNDFSFYDRVLDTCALVGAVPPRYGWAGTAVDLDTYFGMARGVQSGGRDVTAMEMTKWFDTNYHYLVPEFSPDQSFAASTKPVDEPGNPGIGIRQAGARGSRDSLLGKGRRRVRSARPARPVAGVRRGARPAAAAGAPWCSSTSRRSPSPDARGARAVPHGLQLLAERSGGAKILVATCAAGLDANFTALALPTQRT